MHLHGLDLNLLVALDALLLELNVTKAGARLHVGQSAMSGSLARLREHFDDPLLVPVGRKLRKTPLAEELVRPVRAILLQIVAVSETRLAFDPTSSNRCFRVMASDYGSMVVVAKLLRQFTSIAPSIGVEIVPFSNCPAESLEDGKIDILLISQGHIAPNHPSESLFQDAFVCVAWQGNPAFARRITLKQFLKSGHVVVKYGVGGIAHIEENFFQQSGYERRVEVTVSSFSSVPQYIVGTQRIAMMHGRLARIFAQTLPVKILPAPISMPVIKQAMQWHTYRNHDPGGIWFRQQIMKVTAEMH